MVASSEGAKVGPLHVGFQELWLKRKALVAGKSKGMRSREDSRDETEKGWKVVKHFRSIPTTAV